MRTAESNRSFHASALERLHALRREYATAGSEEAVARQHAKKKLTVHERLDLLLDPGAARFEIGTFAAFGIYDDDHGDIRSAGVRTFAGVISGHDCVVIANDSMVKSGTWFPLTIEKILRAQEIALENRLPVVYLVDSGGLFLPLQRDTFAGREHAGRIFYNNARISAAGVPQIAAVMGPCVAGGAYVPALCDELIMVEGTSGIYLAGPYLVRAAVGEKTDSETLGGATTHARLSGMADYVDADDRGALERVRRLARPWPEPRDAGYPREEARAPAVEPEALLDLLPGDRRVAYDMREVLLTFVDAGSLEEYKAEFGRSLIAATARLDGRVIGIVASQRLSAKSGAGELQIGGVIYADAADKAARFVLDMNQKGVPLLFVQDVTGFMVGTRAERGGIIKDGAKLVSAVSNSRVPKLTLIAGNSYGAGNYALCGRAFGPRFVVAWPTAQIAVMGGEQAAETIAGIQRAAAARGGPRTRTGAGNDTQNDAQATDEEELARIRESYETTTSPYYAAARLWIDAIIDPRETRAVLSHIFRLACRVEPGPDFRLGVYQV